MAFWECFIRLSRCSRPGPVFMKHVERGLHLLQINSKIGILVELLEYNVNQIVGLQWVVWEFDFILLRVSDSGDQSDQEAAYTGDSWFHGDGIEGLGDWFD